MWTTTRYFKHRKHQNLWMNNKVLGDKYAIYLWHRKFVTAEQTRQCLSTVNMVFSDKDKIFIKTHKYTQLTVRGVYELKLVHLKCNSFAFSSMSVEYLQKICQTFATCLRCGGYCRMGFVANFIRFPAVQKFENRSRFDKVTESLKVETFSHTV